MATKTPEKDNTHGEADAEPRFQSEDYTSGYDDQFDKIVGKNYSPNEQSDLSKAAREGDPGFESPSGLRNREATAASGATSAVGSDEQSTLDRVNSLEQSGKTDGGLFRKEGEGGRFSGLRGRLSKYSRRKVATLAVASVLGGGGIYGVSVLQGPFQIIQFTKQLQRFQLQPNEDATDGRLSKQIRYLKYLKDPDANGIEKVRLGFFGNAIADRVEGNMEKKAGVKTEYNGGRAKFVIDTDNLKGTQYDEFNGDPDKLERKLRLEMGGVDISRRGSQFVIDPGDSIKANRQLIKGFLPAAGYRKVAGPVAFRIVATRHKATLHPINKLDRKLQQSADERYKAWRAKWSKTVNDGSTLRPTPGTAADSEANGQANETVTEGQETDEAVDEGDEDKLDEYRGNTAAKLGAGGAAGVGVLCALKDIDKNAKDIKQASVIIPMIRMFTAFLALGNQMMTGDDLTMEQVGFHAKQIYGKDSSGQNTSIFQAQSFLSESGKKGGVKPTETVSEAASDKTPFSFTNEGALGSALGPACGPLGIIAQIGFTVATGGLGGVAIAAGGAAAGAVVGPIVMEQAANWLAGNAVDPFAQGADFGNIMTYGGRMMANSQMISAAGRELDETEEENIDKSYVQADREEFQSRSMLARTFDINDDRSLAAVFLSSGTMDIQKQVTNIVSNPAQSIGSLKIADSFSSAVSAQSEELPAKRKWDYGFKQYGFSKEEQENADYDNPYANAKEVVQQILPNTPVCLDCFENRPILEQIRDCFGVHIRNGSFDIVSFNELNGEGPNPTSLPGACNDKSESWTKIRFYIWDTWAMAGTACHQGEKEACELTENAADSENTSGSDPNLVDDGNCNGGKSLGAQDAYVNGNKTSKTICAMPAGGGSTIDVASEISKNMTELLAAAKKDGLDFTGYGFRDMATQERLYAAYLAGTGAEAAKPGYSNHQSGLAVDFGIGGQTICYPMSAAECAGTGNPGFEWLVKNASKYGLKNYPGEAWHWSTDGS